MDTLLDSILTVCDTYLIRAEHNSDIIQFLTNFSRKKDINLATFTALGALKTAKLGFFNQQTHIYEEQFLDFPIELASCTGNVSLKEGKPFVHAHAVLSSEDGKTFGGHLVSGTVFAAEIHLFTLGGSQLERTYDEVTHLSLWNLNEKK